MRVGFIGLGKMGNRMVTKLIEEGHDVVVWNRTRSKAEELKAELDSSPFDQLRAQNDIGSLTITDSIEDLVSSLGKPRIVWSMLPAGKATQETLDEIEKYVEAGDIVID